MKPLTQVAAFVALVFAVPWLVAPLLPQQPQSTWELIQKTAGELAAG